MMDAWEISLFNFLETLARREGYPTLEMHDSFKPRPSPLKSIFHGESRKSKIRRTIRVVPMTVPRLQPAHPPP